MNNPHDDDDDAGALVPVDRVESESDPGALVRRAIASVPARPVVGLLDVYAALLADAKCENTRRSRVDAIEAFRRFLNADTPALAVAAFLGAGRGSANALGLAFRNHEVARGMSAATINARQAMLRRAVKLARRFDVIEFEVEIEDLTNNHQADRRGPGPDGFKALWAAALAIGENPSGLQTQALVRVLYDCALRKNEAITLDIEHVHLDRPALHIMGKGKKGRQFVTMNEATRVAFAKWIESRGDEPGPLFIVQPTRPARCRPIGVRVAQLREEGASDFIVADRLNAEGVAVPFGSQKVWTTRLVEKMFWRVLTCYVPLKPVVTRLVEGGATNEQIAARLNQDGHTLSRSGKPWTAVDVCRYFGTARLRQPGRFTEQVMTDTGLERIHDKWVNRLIHKLAKDAGLPYVVRPHGLRHAAVSRALDLTKGDIRKVQRFARHADPKTTMRYDDDRTDVGGELARMLGDDIPE